MVNDMLQLMTFGQMRKNLFKVEYRKRLGPVLETILKPKLLEECSGLQIVMKKVMSYIEKDCLEFTMQEMTRVCSGLMKSSTRVQ